MCYSFVPISGYCWHTSMIISQDNFNITVVSQLFPCQCVCDHCLAVKNITLNTWLKGIVNRNKSDVIK